MVTGLYRKYQTNFTGRFFLRSPLFYSGILLRILYYLSFQETNFHKRPCFLLIITEFGFAGWNFDHGRDFPDTTEGSFGISSYTHLGQIQGLMLACITLARKNLTLQGERIERSLWSDLRVGPSGGRTHGRGWLLTDAWFPWFDICAVFEFS